MRVCNICAISVSTNTVGYSEENYSVGICPECNNIEKQKIGKDEVEIIGVTTSKRQKAKDYVFSFRYDRQTSFFQSH